MMLQKLKKQIEFHTEQDDNITDVQINYQVKESKNKNYSVISSIVNIKTLPFINLNGVVSFKILS